MNANASPTSSPSTTRPASATGPRGTCGPCSATGVSPIAIADSRSPPAPAPGSSAEENSGATMNSGVTRASTRMKPRECRLAREFVE